MAIKGKKRSQKTRRRAAAPKPVVVVRKRPFLARRNVQLIVVCVLALAAGAGLQFGFSHQSQSSHRAALLASERKVVAAFRDQVTPALAPLGSQTQTGFTAFSSLPAAVKGLQDGTQAPGKVNKTATDTTTAASQAWQTISSIDIAKLVAKKQISRSIAREIFFSQRQFIQSLSLYQAVGRLLSHAANSSGGERAFLVSEAQKELDDATQAMTLGYEAFVQAQVDTGIYIPPAPQPGPPIPSGVVLPSGFPSGNLGAPPSP